MMTPAIVGRMTKPITGEAHQIVGEEGEPTLLKAETDWKMARPKAVGNGWS